MEPRAAPRPASLPPPSPPPFGDSPTASLRGRERLRANLTALYGRIEAARASSARSARSVTLIAVTKAAPPGCFDLLRDIGEKDVGENRVQDAVSKRESAPLGLTWHGIGHLQTNKAKKAVGVFDVFHALDSLHLAAALEPLLAGTGRTWPVFAEINAAHDPKKAGIPPETALAFLESLARFPHLEVVGWMAMPKEADVGDAARPCFQALAALRDEAVRKGLGRVPPTLLSMGMSGDFETAVAEGSTHVRIGRAVWDGVAPDSAVGDAARGRNVSP